MKNKETKWQKEQRRERERAEFLNSDEGKQWLANKRAEQDAYNNEYSVIKSKVSGQTDKAFKVNVTIDLTAIERYVEYTVWIPKSLTKQDGDNLLVKNWFLDKIRKEIRTKYRNNIPFVQL